MSPGQRIGVGWNNGQGQSVTDGMGSPQVTEGSGHRHAITLATKRAFLHGSRGSDRLADCPNFSLPARRWDVAARYGSERPIGVRSSGSRTHLQI